ncbi:MAG: hypothetical protein V1810_01660 [Candidatus Beckwithbacteria bacterium]
MSLKSLRKKEAELSLQLQGFDQLDNKHFSKIFHKLEGVRNQISLLIEGIPSEPGQMIGQDTLRQAQGPEAVRGRRA